MRGRHDGVRHLRFERVVHFPVLLGSANDRGEVLRLRATERVVQADETPAAPDVAVQIRAVLHAHVARVTLVDDHHVDAPQILGRGELQPPRDIRAPGGQNLAPVGKELGVVVLPFGVGLQPGIDVHAQRGKRLWPACRLALSGRRGLCCRRLSCRPLRYYRSAQRGGRQRQHESTDCHERSS